MKKTVNAKLENKWMPYVSPKIRGTKNEPKKLPRWFIIALSGYLLVASLLLVGIAVLRENGYHLINSAIMYYILLAAIAGVLVWLVIGMSKLMRRTGTKRTMSVSATIVAVLVFFYAISIVNSHLQTVTVDAGRSTSPDGENRLVILRSHYIDIERMDAELREQYPDFNDDQITDAIIALIQTNSADSDLLFQSYAYMAYPIRAGIFYYTGVEVGPEILVVADDSEAQLRVRWDDDATATLYVDEPGPYDRGEFTVKCE